MEWIQVAQKRDPERIFWAQIKNKDWDQTFCTNTHSSLRGWYASVNGSIFNDVSADRSARTSRPKQSRPKFVLVLRTPVFKWCHLIRCCMSAVHAFWPKLESQRTPQIAPFCRHSLRRSVLPLRLLTLFALRLPIALLSLSSSPLTSYVSSDEENINYLTWHWRRGLQHCGGMYWKTDSASQYRMRNSITDPRPCFKLTTSLESTVPYWRLSGDISRTTEKPNLRIVRPRIFLMK